ncbi:unnamed protein product, partial [Iphiclides podalirius]
MGGVEVEGSSEGLVHIRDDFRSARLEGASESLERPKRRVRSLRMVTKLFWDKRCDIDCSEDDHLRIVKREIPRVMNNVPWRFPVPILGMEDDEHDDLQ